MLALVVVGFSLCQVLFLVFSWRGYCFLGPLVPLVYLQCWRIMNNITNSYLQE